MRKRVISGLLMAVLVLSSMLMAFVYYILGGSILEAVGGLLMEVLVAGFFLAFLLLHRLYRTRLTRFLYSFSFGLLTAGWMAVFIIGARLDLPFLLFLNGLLFSGVVAAMCIGDLLPERKEK